MPLRCAQRVDIVRNLMHTALPLGAWFGSMIGLAACSVTSAPPTDPPAPRPIATELAPAPADSSSAVARSDPPDAGRATLERELTGQEQPTVVVRNGYPKSQHVFIDGRAVGTVASGQSATFAVTEGVHTVTGADSADPDDHPSSVTETFERGYAYRYVITAK